MSRALMIGKEIVDAVYQGDEQIYGRNLLPAFTSDKWNVSQNITYDNYKLVMPEGVNSKAETVVDVELDTDYTMTFNSDYARYFIFEWVDGSAGTIIKTILEGSDVYTFNSKNLTQIQIIIDTWSQRLDRERNVWELKLEKGTHALPWSPAPEDLINSLKPQTYPLAII